MKNSTPKFIIHKGLKNTIKVGDTIHITDYELDINTTIRIQSLEFPLVNPSAITMEVNQKNWIEIK